MKNKKKNQKSNKGATLRLNSLSLFSSKFRYILVFRTIIVLDEVSIRRNGFDEMSCTPRDEVYIVLTSFVLIF